MKYWLLFIIMILIILYNSSTKIVEGHDGRGGRARGGRRIRIWQ